MAKLRSLEEDWALFSKMVMSKLEITDPKECEKMKVAFFGGYAAMLAAVATSETSDALNQHCERTMDTLETFANAYEEARRRARKGGPVH